jgi:TPP-dependent pyruvate/acetoin dehydrogenase alpha subunit
VVVNGKRYMQRYIAYDPPEYVGWESDPTVADEFLATINSLPERAAIISGLAIDEKLDLYRGMLRTRLHDIMLKRWVKQGVISKAWLGTGEEAATIGPVHALDRSKDFTAPMIRNAGACCEMGMPITDMLRGYLGTADSPSHGRDGHVGSFEHRVLQPVSNIGNIPPVTVGLALALKMRGEEAVAVTWIGDGSVKSGPIHEALNMAAVMRLPVIFILQNNQVALGTRTENTHRAGDFSDFHVAYGMQGWDFDGNNVLDAYAATRLARDVCIAGEGPVLLSTETFRMGGHATHDEAEARAIFTEDEYDYWGKRDPVGMYEDYLKTSGVDANVLEEIEAAVVAEVDRAGDEALESKKDNMPLPESALTGVFYSQ